MMADIKNTKAFYNTEIPGDWEVRHFEDIADIDKESLNGSTPKDYEFDYISLSDVDSDDFHIETTRQVFDTAPSRARRIVKQGDILMSTVRPNLQGFSLIRNEVKDLIASTGFAVITAKKCINEYLFQYLFSSGIERQFYQLLVGSNYPAINSSDVRKLKIPLPPLPEQKAIAQVLSTADAAIHTTEKLIAQKELRKKWLMQQLLTGKKRLLNDELGMMNDEWKPIRIGDIFKFIKSYSISREGLQNDDEGSVFCIHYGDIHARYDSLFLDFERQKNIPQLIDENISIEEGNYLQDGDIVMADASEDYEGVGAAVEIKNLIGKKAIGGLHTLVLRADREAISPNFAAYFFSSEKVRNTLRKYATGTSVYSVTKTQIHNLSFIIPNSLKEQTAIAQVLQAADKEISLLKAKAEKMREQKKGLMQVLLTGKKRLNQDFQDSGMNRIKNTVATKSSKS